MRVAVLDQRHPEHDHECLERNRALYCGGEEWRELVEWWLPKHPEEADESYDARKSRALYENHVGPLVDMLATSVFTEAPRVDGMPGDWWPAFGASVDGRGTGLAPWFRDRLVDLLVERRTYVWVNLPARPDGLVVDSRASEEAAGLLDAFLVWVSAENVIDWSRDDRGRLRWVMIRDEVEEREALESERVEVHRWTYIDAQVIRRWTWTPQQGRKDPLPTDEAEEQPLILHGIGTLPLVELELTEGLHALGKLHDPAVAHLRARNDLSWALHRAAHALLVIKSKWNDQRPVLGPGYYLKLDQADSAEYVEPSGANFEILASDVKDLREELYRVVQSMAQGIDSSASRSAASGDSKGQDWRALEIVLSALASTMRTSIASVLRLVATARGLKDAEPTVTGLDGWQEEDLETWLKAAAMATDASKLSPTFTKLVAKRQARRVLQTEDPAELAAVDKEIDAAEVDLSLFNPSPTQPAGGAP